MIANRNEEDSVRLAEYYMEKRDIDPAQLCVLDLPVDEEISLDDYERLLKEPLLQFLRDGDFITQTPAEVRPTPAVRAKRWLQGLVGKAPADPEPRPAKEWLTQDSRIRILVPMRGVPLRIANFTSRVKARLATDMDNASEKSISAVDSELSALLMDGLGFKGSMRNPIYNTLTWSEAGSLGARVLIVSRLDAPTAPIVRRMIDDSIDAERYGIQGPAYFDARGLRSGRYFTGDYWIRDAAERMELSDYSCVLDFRDAVFARNVPMEEPAIYLGWYTENMQGPFENPDFHFAPGAVAYHLHSGAAATLRSDKKHWAGPLLSRGAAATFGAVHEPYLRLTLDLDLFMRRLATGYSFGESAYMALPVLSWQMAVIGDPLYRPFVYTLDQQIEHMEQDGYSRLPWGYARKTLQLVRNGFFNVALDYLRQKIMQTESLVLRELLGDLYMKNNLLADAGVQYDLVLQATSSAATATRVGQRWAAVLDAARSHEEADQVRDVVRQRFPGSPYLSWLDEKGVSF